MAASTVTLDSVAAPRIQGVRAEAGYIPAIEGLRGIAVLWVVLFHYVVIRDGRFDDPVIAAIAAVRPLNVIARNGYLGVDLFFLITGFLLAIPWFLRDSRGEPPPSLREFYARRFWRIAPAYYVQLVLLFLFVLPLLRGFAYWRTDLYVLAFNGAAHAVFLQNTTPLTSGSLNINGALWTLTAEAQYYLLLPLIAPFFVRAPRAALVAAIAIAAAWHVGARHGLDSIVRLQLALGTPWAWTEAMVRQVLLTQLPSYFAHFALGILAGRAWVRWRAKPLSPSRRSALLLAAIAALGALYAVFGHLGPVLGELSWMVSPLALCVAFFALAANDRRGQDPKASNPVLGNGSLRFFGRVSYSAYLYHLLVLALWNAFMPALGWASLPLYLATVFTMAWVSWRFVEAPFMRKRLSAR